MHVVDLAPRPAILLNLYFLFLTFTNIRFLHRYSNPPAGGDTIEALPKVSIILPVRNEEQRLRECLDSMFAQSYPSIGIVAIDDNSADATASILAEYAGRDDRLVVVRGEPLPSGWSGKSYACQQGIQAASGDYLLFTDADTGHGAESISWAVQSIRKSGVDFLSASFRARAPTSSASRSVWIRTTARRSCSPTSPRRKVPVPRRRPQRP